MKFLNKFFLLYISILTFGLTSCDKDSAETKKDPGELSILFDNKLGSSTISLKDYGNRNFDYMDTDGQELNITEFAYYVIGIELEGPEGVKHIDPLNISADASQVTGYYHVRSDVQNSNVITLKNIEPGIYSKIKFTIGVDESGVQQGAAGGVLDPANGAWFWNWNAGYIGFGVEGNASTSAQQYVLRGNGSETLEGTFAVHVGGWKDLEPEAGQDPKFVNNIKVIELNFDSDISIESGLNPEAHINVRFEELLKGNDFSSTYAVHRPDLGKPFANKLANVFELDHVHQ